LEEALLLEGPSSERGGQLEQGGCEVARPSAMQEAETAGAVRPASLVDTRHPQPLGSQEPMPISERAVRRAPSVDARELRRLRDELLDERAEQRAAALEAIAACGGAAADPTEGGDPAVVKDIGRLLSDPDADVRYVACLTIVSLGKAAQSVFRDVLKLLKEEADSKSVRRAAVEALVVLTDRHGAPSKDRLARARQSSAADAATQAIAKELCSVDAEMRGVAALGLAEIHVGFEAASLVVALLVDPDICVRQAALMSLARMADFGWTFSADQAEAVSRRLREPLLRDLAAGALARFGSAAAPLARELLPFLGDSDPRVRQAVVDALADLGPHLAPDLVTELRAMASTSSPDQAAGDSGWRSGVTAAARGAEAASLAVAQLPSRNPSAAPPSYAAVMPSATR